MPPAPLHPARELPATEHVDFRAIYYLMRERLWLVLLCLLLAGSVTVAYLLRATRIYAAKVVLQVEQEEAKILKIERVQEEHLQTLESVKTVEQTLRNRTLLARVIQNNRLESNPRFLPVSPDGPRSPEQLVDALSSMVDAKLRRGTRLIDLVVEHPVPQLTAVIANSIVREYIRQNFEANATAAEVAGEFLEKEALGLKEKLEESENALQAYKERTGASSLEDQQNTVVQKLKELSARVTEAKSQRIIQEATYAQAKSVGDDPQKLLILPAVASDLRIQEIRSQIARVESEVGMVHQRYRKQHPKYIQAESQLAEWESALERAVLNVPETIRISFEMARGAEEALDAALTEQETAALALNRQAIRYNQLLRDVESDRTLYQALLDRIKETAVTKDLQSSKVRVIQEASIPEWPIKPDRFRVVIVGLMAGLSLGLGLAFFLHSLDRSIKTVDQAEAYLGLPVLAIVPRLADAAEGNRRLISTEEANSPAGEAFRTLRTSISMLGRKEDRRTFLFTSAIPSEGKTFCSLNFAASLAQQGLRTLVIDGDLRRPMVEKSLCNNNQRGFGVTDYLTGNKTFEAVVHPTEVENFSYIPAGTHAPNPVELLAQTGIDGLIDEALLHFDRVIIDSAPIHAVSDTLLMLRRVQTLCLIVRCRKTAKNAVRRAVQILQEAEAPLAGLILNYMPRSRGGAYSYDSYYHYSYYGYYSDQEKKDQRTKKPKPAKNNEMAA